jgi:CNT family concentrative nucleoside transporter
MGRYTGLLGIVVILGIAWALSADRKRINWRLVGLGSGAQLLFALLILKTPWGRATFDGFGRVVTGFLDLSDEGSRFIFGDNFQDHFFAFKVLPTIIFFSSFITVLYYLGVMQWVVRGFAWLMVRLLRTSGAESLSASANIFVGQTEAPLLIRPFIASLTNSELMAVMTGGFATVAGGVLVAYVGILRESFPDVAGHLLAASVMSAPAALVMAKLMVPETEKSMTAGNVSIEVEKPWVNVIDAAAEGAGQGLKLALNVGAMLLAFIGLIAVVNFGLGWVGGFFGFAELSLEWLLGWLLRPLAWVMGVPWAESGRVGALLGLKTASNEFYAYIRMGQMIAENPMSERATVVATYALCGFANFSSIAIQIGGIGAIAPERKPDLARLGMRAMVAGALACFQTATIAGLLI